MGGVRTDLFDDWTVDISAISFCARKKFAECFFKRGIFTAGAEWNFVGPPIIAGGQYYMLPLRHALRRQSEGVHWIGRRWQMTPRLLQKPVEHLVFIEV